MYADNKMIDAAVGEILAAERDHHAARLGVMPRSCTKLAMIHQEKFSEKALDNVPGQYVYEINREVIQICE